MTELWVIESTPKAGRGHGRNDLNFGRFAFDVTLMTACGGNWSTRAPRGGNLQLRLLGDRLLCARDVTPSMDSNKVCLFLFFFVLDLMSVKKKKQLEARCQPLILTCKTSEEKRPCRTRSNDVDMSIRGFCECAELANGPLVNMSNSTCNKTKVRVFVWPVFRCGTSFLRTDKNCQTVQFEHWGEAHCERTLKRLRLHDLRSCIFAEAKARPMLTKQQKLESNSDYETWER